MIDELLERRETGVMLPEKNPVVWATVDLEDKGGTEYQSPTLGVQKGYSIRLVVGVNFFANPAQLEAKEQVAIKQLKHELYKDLIGDIYAALNICDDAQTRRILSGMLTKMGI